MKYANSPKLERYRLLRMEQAKHGSINSIPKNIIRKQISGIVPDIKFLKSNFEVVGLSGLLEKGTALLTP